MRLARFDAELFVDQLLMRLVIGEREQRLTVKARQDVETRLNTGLLSARMTISDKQKNGALRISSSLLQEPGI